MHTPQRADAARSDDQLIRRFRRRRGAALQRQQADDQLQAVDEPMLELLRQHDLALRQFMFFLKQTPARARGRPFNSAVSASSFFSLLRSCNDGR